MSQPPQPGPRSGPPPVIQSGMPSRSRRAGGLTALLAQRERLRDLAFLLGLSALALIGFAPTFTGIWFFVVGVLGVVIGIGAVQLAHARRWPAVAAILLTVAAFFVLGGPLCLRSEGASAYLPLPSTLGSLVDQLIFGWKDLLTTLPPVDGDGSALVIPWVMGLATGLSGALLVGAHRWRHLPAQVGVVLPVLVPVALLVGVILLGTQHPASVLVQGVLFAAAALAWLALRSLALATRTGSGAGTGFARRGLAGLALVGLAAALAWPIGTWLAGSEDERVVLRSYVEPPFDIGDYPSPLAGFRKYVELPDKEAEQSSVNLHDKTLFTISGVEPGTRVRFAALENYDGMVWRAAEDVDPTTSLDTYQRVSSTIDNPVEGEEVEAEVTLGEGYSDVWLPTVGALRHLTFDEDSDSQQADAIEDSFRYNLAASTGIVPAGLRPGESYRFTAVLPDDSLGKTTAPSTDLPAAYQSAAFLDTQANDWTQGEIDPMARVFAAAEHLRTVGRFSDGVAPKERIYHAGHNQKRLGEEFVNYPIMAGNAEQYAATMALLANRIGVPARVVMGALVPADGVVTGAEVTAWVELQAADGSWRTLPTEAFMGRQKPADQPPQQEEEMSGSVVPPPAPIPPPSTEGEQTDTQLKTRSEDEDDDSGWSVPLWLQIVLVVLGSPLLLLALVLGSILGAKAWRRHRRRTRGHPSARIGGGWRELVDNARDLGHGVPVASGLTRREQAQLLDTVPAHQLARSADGHVFGPTPPGEDEVASYWQGVDEQRAAMRSSESRWTRFKAMLSLRTFRRRWAREPEQIVPRSEASRQAEDPRNKHGHELVEPS